MELEVEQVLKFCPDAVVQALRELDTTQQGRVEEIRLRMGQTATVGVGGREWALRNDRQPIVVDGEMLTTLVNKASGFSTYAVADMLRNGYLIVPGGHRIGICGTVQPNRTMVDVSSANIRIARQMTGFAEEAMNLLWANPKSTLIAGPPGCGKTTLLREMIRQLSDRFRYRMSVVDERWEIAGSVNGVPQLQVGKHTDVLTGASKPSGIEMLLRGMNPQWIAVDEITAKADVEAMMHASYCGVRMLATAHADGKEDLHRRPMYRNLLELGLFQNLIVLDHNKQMTCERLNNEYD